MLRLTNSCSSVGDRNKDGEQQGGTASSEWGDGGWLL